MYLIFGEKGYTIIGHYDFQHNHLYNKIKAVSFEFFYCVTYIMTERTYGIDNPRISLIEVYIMPHLTRAHTH